MFGSANLMQNHCRFNSKSKLCTNFWALGFSVIEFCSLNQVADDFLTIKVEKEIFSYVNRILMMLKVVS